MILAESIADGVPGWVTALGGASATAILGWYAWFTATKTIPNLVNDFRSEMSESRKSCAEEKKSHLDSFRAELKEERQHRENSSQRIASALDRLSESVRAKQ